LNSGTQAIILEHSVQKAPLQVARVKNNLK